ncbi:hypothetical protein GPECTOR_14g233 [Gonium pectorale]|uniref:Uncharacterized protein n=1 Tax=Gonium pectorale TaxID=33097 RepID=A0A150GMN5_GONPE|nr:hypothetical protein GPECTOR_14g233 [Gonium pectorale]|eukprot:KXZ50992.1 hypothetical protein GPECTOR_14g233 [Gonium pectorale]
MAAGGGCGRSVAEAAGAEAAAGGAAAVEGSKKKRKTGAAAAAAAANGSGAGSGGALTVTEASVELRGHLHCVSGCSWAAEESLFSAGWDHSVRRWDVETGAAADVYNGSKAVLCLATHGSAPHLVAFGCADRALRLWDSRGPAPGADALAVTTHGSHAGWVAAVAWRPDSAHHLATAGHDGAVKLWDLRTRVPLGSLSDGGDKLLAVGWLGGSGGAFGTRGLVAGGADCRLRLYEGDGGAAAAV